jgi:hypothetical protein
MVDPGITHISSVGEHDVNITTVPIATINLAFVKCISIALMVYQKAVYYQRFFRALPLDVRKSCAFPESLLNDCSGEAANLEGDATVKQSFTAHRQAEPEDHFH